MLVARVARSRLMLVELSVVEQRYHAVMEVAAGLSVTEVAARYEVSRRSVYTWMGRYRGAEAMSTPCNPWQSGAVVKPVEVDEFDVGAGGGGGVQFAGEAGPAEQK